MSSETPWWQAQVGSDGGGDIGGKPTSRHLPPPVLTLLSDPSLGLGTQVPERERGREEQEANRSCWLQSGIAPDLSDGERSPGTMEAVAVVPSR